MDQLFEFIAAHPLLWAALAVIVVAFIANEVWRGATGRGPIAPDEAIRLMNSEDAVVVDTRSKADYKKSHIINARHVPLSTPDTSRTITRSARPARSSLRNCISRSVFQVRSSISRA